ncbi:carbohydrate esterase family 12 protein [Coleophoma cylindrospora]|uniref:Carbohydrate esterase family 12 protein n=1 Tax=Coleophoma cylindrospora TaxID=1849047 RepID=A0A3D8SFM5_9HELO|nr:carbohydrate esterase family 12 protein [Coleophoma cylindrospora]
MKSFTQILVAATALATQVCATPTLYLAGDSTMALGGGGTGTQGFGEYLKYSFSGINVVNKAVAGRSARSYWNEGKFAALADLVVAGDYVLFEFGHNDGGSLSTTDNNRTDCYGAGSETCISPVTGETVYTYVFYLLQAGRLMTAKGAHVVVASPTPDNPWESGTFSYSSPRFTGYGQTVVTSLGSLAAFVDHGTYVANRFQSLGATAVDAFYPNDHTHTSPAGANVVAGAFMKGLMCGGSALSAYSKNTTSSIAGSCV